MGKKKYDTDTRNFWVVSPNVADDENTVEEWKEASTRYHAAFMGTRLTTRDLKELARSLLLQLRAETLFSLPAAIVETRS